MRFVLCTLKLFFYVTHQQIVLFFIFAILVFNDNFFIHNNLSVHYSLHKSVLSYIAS